jgi:LuxR family transcriptional regulator, maltose regulon positive regulatory protein
MSRGTHTDFQIVLACAAVPPEQNQRIRAVVPDAKIEIPRPAPGAIRRRHVESLLPRAGDDSANDSTNVLGTLVCAPPGYGKTTVLSRWAREHGAGSVAWLDVDSADDPALLCAGMLAAVTRAVTPRRNPLPDLRVGADTIVAHLVDLVDIVDRHHEPVWLVLDGLDRFRHPEALQIPELLVRRARRRLRLVLSTRHYPATGLHFLRMAGLLREIRADDLAFTAEETAQLLANHEVHLDDEDLSRLMRVTEGWPAAVGSAAETLAAAADRRSTLDYLAEGTPRVTQYCGPRPGC